MSVSLFSFLMSVGFSTVFILVIHVLRNQPIFLKSFGVHTLLTMYALCLCRMIFVIELPFTVPVELRGAFSQAYALMRSVQISTKHSSIGFMDVLLCIWIIPAVIIFIRFVWQECATRIKVLPYRRNKNYAAERALAKARNLSPRKLDVNVCVCQDIDTPMGFGLFHKWIFLPDEEYAKDELFYIMMHEYTHFCNRDGMVKLLTLLLCCVFWWNPAVYLLKKDVEQILEIKCDINATQDFNKKERLEYLLTIVQVLKGEPKAKGIKLPQTATGLFSRTEDDDIRERFALITKAAATVGLRYRAIFVGLAVLVTVFSYLFVFQPAFDPPVEDIYTDSSVQEYDESECYIIEDDFGHYYMVFSTGERYAVSEKIAKDFIVDGTEYKRG